MKAQKTSFFKKFYTANAAALFLLVFVSTEAFGFGGIRPTQIPPAASGDGEARIWRGGTSEDAPNAEIIRGLTVLGTGNLSGAHDCDDPRQQILDEMLTQVDIIGPTDDRNPIPEARRPYVAELIGIDDDGNEIIYGNAWQPKDNGVVVVPAHLLADNGVWYQTGTETAPNANQLARVQVRFAGCSEPVALERIVDYGTLSPGNNPGNDWVVATLAEDSCLRPDQLANPMVVAEEYMAEYFLPGGAHRKEITAAAFIDRTTIGNTVPSDGQGVTSGITWTAEDSELRASEGFITELQYYRPAGPRDIQLLDPIQRGNPGVEMVWVFDADIDEGNSGGVIHLEGQMSEGGQSFELNHVIGMIVALLF